MPQGFDDLTVEEVIAIEDRLNTPIDKLANPNAKKGPLIQAMAWVIGRRTDPDFTWEQALKQPVTSVAPGGRVDPSAIDELLPSLDSSPISVD